MRIRFALCDDDAAQLSYLTALVHTWAEQRDIAASIDAFGSAEAFLFAYGEEGNYDILLLDIQMKATSGLELARELRRRGDRAQIIFITGYADYMAEGYDVAALHYLTKPVHEEKLREVLDRATTQLQSDVATVLLPHGTGHIRLPAAEIAYAEAFSHQVLLCTDKETLTFTMRISDMERLLDGAYFLRCHRSYIVNILRARRVTRTAILLDNGSEIPLSRALYDQACQLFIRFC